MAALKMITCVISGKEIQKRKSKLVLDHRVCPEVEGMAKGLLIDAVSVFIWGWKKHNKSARNRTMSLAYCVSVITACTEAYGCEPTVFVTELGRQAEAAGEDVSMVFFSKLLDFISGDPVPELEKPNVQKAIRMGVEAFKEQVAEQ